MRYIDKDPYAAAPLSAQPVALREIMTLADEYMGCASQEDVSAAEFGLTRIKRGDRPSDRARAALEDRVRTALYTTPPPPADAGPVEMTAKPLNWEKVQPDTWADDTGFYITFDADDDEPYFAAWGEGAERRHKTLEEAQQWCCDYRNAWVQKIAVAAPADARGSEALREAVREALTRYGFTKNQQFDIRRALDEAAASQAAPEPKP